MPSCAARPLALRSQPPPARQGRTRRALAVAPQPAPAQQPFAFLAEVPLREERREARAHRPHLRARTPATDERGQLVLPFQKASRKGWLLPEVAEAFERALAEARGGTEGSPRQRAAEGRLLHLLHPFLASEARQAWASHERTFLSRMDLLQEALLRAQKLWRGFTPGKAGPGRTLYPAYVQQAVRQHLGNVLADARLVGPTQWGRKLAARARRRVEKEGTSYEEALRAEKADGPTALALSLGATRVEETEAALLADTGEEERAEAQLGAAAAALLQRLPRRQRLAVAVPLGLARVKLPDARLAKELGCTVAELLEARAAGLAQLREQLEASC